MREYQRSKIASYVTLEMEAEDMKDKRKYQSDLSFKIERPAPLYPYDERTDTISLPPEVEKEVKDIVLSKGVPSAVKRVMDLTGAGLKVSKDYIDRLCERRVPYRSGSKI